MSPPRPLRISEKEDKKVNTSGDKQKAKLAGLSRKNRLSGATLRRRKEEKAMYTEYGYIGFDGIEYATEDEAYEAYVESINESE